MHTTNVKKTKLPLAPVYLFDLSALLLSMDLSSLDSDRLPPNFEEKYLKLWQREGGDIIDLFLGIIKFLSATEFPPSFPLTIVRVYGNFVSLLTHICRDMDYLSVVSPNAGK